MKLQKWESYLVFVGILLLACLFYWPHFNAFPSHIHAWAQSDYYALAKGFLRNGFNFFEPSTFIYNTQFPDHWSMPNTSPITAVDFPIHAFIVALLMQLFGTSAPWVFELYTLLYSCIGLLYLYKLARLMNLSVAFALLVVLFAGTSPVYVYYQSGFLPSIASMSNALIGCYFMLGYFKHAEVGSFHKSVFFLCLATLSRSTYALVLVAALGVWFLTAVKRKNWNLRMWLSVVGALAIIALYAGYNAYLRTEYGSNFLNHLLPAHNWQEARYFIYKALFNWGYDYFSLTHYLIVGAMVVGALLGKFKGHHKGSELENKLLGLLLFLFIGGLLFACAMLQQFTYHDYYFIDAFYLPIVLLVVWLLSCWEYKLEGIYRQVSAVVVLAGLGVLLIGLTIKKEAVRTASGKEDATEALIGAFKGGDGFLDSLHIARDAKVEVVNGVAPNIPLLLLDRVGYSIMDVSKKSLDEALTWDFDYFVMQKDDFLNRLIRLSPTLPTHLEGVGVNKKLIVCKVVKQATTDQFMRFIGLPPYIHSSCLFDTSTTLSPNWSNLHSGENEFGITYKEGNLPYFYKQGLKLFCTFDLRADRLKDCFLVVCVKSGDKTVSYQNFDLKKFFVADSHWQEKQFIIDVPQSTYAMNNFELYIWNKGKNAFEIRNFTFTLY